jgi:hypothetical protein
MIADQRTLMILIPVFVGGVLLFDLILLLFNGQMTISRSIWRTSCEHPVIGIVIAAALAFLILHLFTSFV